MADAAPGPARGSESLAVEARGLEVRYPRAARPALQIDDLRIGRGERLALIGPSGGGKTTLIRTIAGLVEPSAGLLRIGRTVGPGAGLRETGLIFQDFALVERASVFENVLYGRLGQVGTFRSLFGAFPEEDRRIAWAMIQEVGLGDLVHRRVDRLSGGQRQRVAIARALAQQPAILLADEPVSNLDPSLTDDILGLLGSIWRRHGVTLITSLHQPRLAERVADRMLGIRDGRIVFDGPPDRLSPAGHAEIYGPEPSPADGDADGTA
ncbi:MAG: ATP-binding cassette domain-containing protein [Geminicoccaceae bacterium]|nr:ATP-binding cassette domain-containing protein [Geminicoccaceae bacterium]